ncbi:hypothetical protein [Nannocystis radixulma]|uniref:Uncharacterized protein n=1 Tax=Nannocystis radixulma TaxID=2995305 RepID=A0ABT5AYC0_9BACT|nr:hypothetical protein [Nannocystis radixulma]MDC0666836.1 hypothetical protein [Nannocystis radixulma]
MSNNRMCPHCHHTSLRRPPAWGIAVVALAWVFVATMLFASALIGPFIMFAVPVIFAFGAGAIGSAHDFAFAAPHCPACGKLALADAPATAQPPARELAPALARAA